MGWYREWLLPRCIHFALSNRECQAARGRITRGLSGQVLEIGFGSGLNLPQLPREVSRLYALDPATTGRNMARHRVRDSHAEVVFLDWREGAYPLPDNSVDALLSTWTLCTITDLEAAFSEMRRVLKPGGCCHFLEHGLSPQPGVCRWQQRLTPLQKRIAGGCRLDRDIAALVRAGGFVWQDLESYYMKGARIFSWMYEGRARLESG